jgi:O-antigen ligase
LVWTLKRGNAHLTQAINTRHLIRPAATFSPSDAEKDAQSGEGESLSCDTISPWLNKNWLSLSAILLSVVVLFFWHLRQTTWHPARRALSAVNAVDFSWRNRIAAWEGDLQITAEHPWFGTGWNQPEPLYEHYYLPPRLTESAAIQMNDYLMLGTTLGIPALFCFGMYVWLSLTTNSGARIQKPESALPPSIFHSPSSILLAATCRAGAIVLLVGFWFDGGLFKLATASTFWILLELGRADLVQQKVTK